MDRQAARIIHEVKKAVIGKDMVIKKLLAATLARGLVLLEDRPGVGKTTLAVAFSRALSLDYKRLQFTPEILPADVGAFPSTAVRGKASPISRGRCSAICFWPMRSTGPAPRPRAPFWRPWRRGR